MTRRPGVPATLRIVLAGLRRRKRRLVATALAIVLGVGFVVGTLVFGDTARAAFFEATAREARNVDVTVLPQPDADDAGDRLPPDTVDRVRAVPGVAAADTRTVRSLPLLDSAGRLAGNAGLAVAVGAEARLRPFDVVTGRLPAAPGEAALEVRTAERAGYRVGRQITVLDTGQRRRTLTLVGTVDVGASRAAADQSMAVLTGQDLAALTGDAGYRQVVAVAGPGVRDGELARRVRAALPGDPQVMTGRRYRFEVANDQVGEITPFLAVLLIFAGIAVVVAAFIIVNTFAILVAQRARETALLRCLGAGRGQVFGSVVLESGVVGLFGSLAGIGLGLLVARGLQSGFSTTVIAIPDRTPALTPTPVVAGLFVGVVVTMVSALLPAVRATRVPPLAALRATPGGPGGPGGVPGTPGGATGRAPRAGAARRRRLPLLAAAGVAVAGTAVTVAGLRADHHQQTALLLVVAGGVINFLAVVIVSPRFVGPLVTAIGAVPARLLGTPLRLAVANARRAPGRTAATAAALMIGVGLMAAASVTTATVRATAEHEITSHYPVDYLLSSLGGAGDAPDGGVGGADPVGIPAPVADRLREDSRLATVIQVRGTWASATLDAPGGGGSLGRGRIGAFDPHGLATLPPLALSAGAQADLRPGTAIVSRRSPMGRDRRLGDRLRLTADGGRGVTVTLVGLAETLPTGYGALLAWDDLTALRPADTDDTLLVKAAPGASPRASRTAVRAVTDGYPLVDVGSIAEAKQQITAVVDTMILIVASLLGFAIIIALIGIMNTVALSVLERTRESATVRALGLTRGQLRATLLAEAVLTAAASAVVGITFGVGYGWLTTRVMYTGYQVLMRIPFGQLALYLALAMAAGGLAATLPARRAARASIVSAMTDA